MTNNLSKFFGEIGKGGCLHIAELMVYRHELDFSILSGEREKETCPETGRPILLMPTLKEAFNSVFSLVLDKRALNLLSDSIGEYERLLMDEPVAAYVDGENNVTRILTKEEKQLRFLVENLETFLLLPQNNAAIFEMLDDKIPSLSDVKIRDIQNSLVEFKKVAENSKVLNTNKLDLEKKIKQDVDGFMSDFCASHDGVPWVYVEPDPNLSEKIEHAMSQPFKPYL